MTLTAGFPGGGGCPCGHDDAFCRLFGVNPLPMWVLAVDDLAILAVNDAAVAHYGYPRQEFLALRVTDLHPAGDHEQLRREMAAPGDRRPVLCRHVRRDGSVIEVEVRSHPMVFGGRAASLAVIQDLTERLATERKLAHQALHDALTDLPNRTLLIERVGRAIREAGDAGRKAAVIFLDLDRFKTINDGRGHLAGDRLLVEVADRLRRAVRHVDTVARVGGDEFVLLIDGVADSAEAAGVSRRVAWSLDAPFRVEGGEVYLTASQGIAVTDGAETAEELLAKADTAMYWAKEQGPGRAEMASDAVLCRARSRLDAELALRRAIEEEQLVLHYQPVMALPSDGIVGAEALVRWNHPERGLLAPSEFLPVAESSGLIVPLGEWVLTRALDEAASWRGPDGRSSSASVAVNLSPRQLMAPNLVFFVARALRSAGVDPGRLRLEVTEGDLIRDFDRAAEVLAVLRDLGVRIDVDDFGTGYASFGYLQRLPIDALKIDRSFVARLGAEVGDESIVSTVLQLSRSLDLTVIAEGVETERQSERLVALGCTLAQGHHFARPVPAPEFRRLLREQAPAAVGASDRGGAP